MRADLRLFHAVLALAEPERRAEGVSALCELLGARAVIPLVADIDVGALLPVPGLRPTLPGGRGWAAMLKACASQGITRCNVAYEYDGLEDNAVACSTGHAALVFVGVELADDTMKEIAAMLPALGAGWRAELMLQASKGTLRAAQEGARDARALADVLQQLRSELESKARSLEEARARAEQSARAKDEFLAMLGHELRNPLAPIVTALELMRLDGHQSRELQIIERQVEHMRRLVGDLLDVSRTARGRLEIQTKRVEISTVITQAIEMASPLLEGRRQFLELRVPDAGLLVDGDPGRLAQVVSNLLTNASRYSEPGSRIQVIAENAGVVVRIRVIDEGIGIDPAFLPDIFDAFTRGDRRAHEAGSDHGLGLGLRIVKALVQVHHGTVRVESDGPGRGSQFIIELPRCESGEPSPEVSPAVSQHRAAPGTRVLIVDDNTDITELLSDLLVQRGYETEVAADGPSALEIADAFEPAIGLLDLGLPVMDGWELAKRLLDSDKHKGMKLVAISGYGQASDFEHTRIAGFRAHLVKPIDFASLAELLEELAKAD